MILQALTQYYQRKADNDSDIAPQGFEYKQIPFIIVIDKDGNFVQLEDTRDVDIKNKKTKQGNQDGLNNLFFHSWDLRLQNTMFFKNAISKNPLK